MIISFAHRRRKKKSPQVKNKMPYCTSCTRTFTTAAAVRQHLATSSSAHPHCHVCDRNFGSESSLNQHLGTSRCHRFHCRDCNIAFTNQGALSQHRSSSAHSSGSDRVDGAVARADEVVTAQEQVSRRKEVGGVGSALRVVAFRGLVGWPWPGLKLVGKRLMGWRWGTGISKYRS